MLLNLSIRIEIYAWEISGNLVSIVGIKLNMPVFLNLYYSGNLLTNMF